MEIMMQLGSFQFGLATAAYQEFTRSTAYTWASQARFGQDDALQSTGPGADEVSLTGIVYPEFRGGTGQLDDLRALAAEQQPLTMIDGRGNMLRQWVIESIDDHGSIFAQAGIARKQEFSVKLRRFPDDALNSDPMTADLAAAVAKLPAGNTPAKATEIATTAVKAPESLISNLNSSLQKVTGVANQIGSQSQSIISAVKGGINTAMRLRNAGKDTLNLLKNVRNISDISSAMSSLSRFTSGMSQAAGNSSSILRQAGITMTANGVDIAIIKTVKDAMISINQVNVLAVKTKTDADIEHERMLAYLRANTTIQ